MTKNDYTKKWEFKHFGVYNLKSIKFVIEFVIVTTAVVRFSTFLDPATTRRLVESCVL